MKEITVRTEVIDRLRDNVLSGAVFKDTAVENGDGTSTFVVDDEVAESLAELSQDPNVAIERLTSILH